MDVDALMKAIRPREHRVFAGKLDRGNLGFAERAIARACGHPKVTSATGTPSLHGRNRLLVS